MALYFRRSVLLSIVLPLIHTVFAQNVDSMYDVATWYGFRQAAVNFTFDDGCANQFAKAIPLFNELDFSLTLFTVTNWATDWNKLQQTADSGHEVASHTVSHPNLLSLDSDKQMTEFAGSKTIIENNITGQRCLTIAYPYCATGIDSICHNYYIAARGCQGFIEPPTPGSFLNISSIICGSEGSVKTLNDFKSRLLSAAEMNGWCVFLIHGIDNDGGYSPLQSAELRNVMVYLNTRRIKYWVTTFLNTTLYARERNALSVTETSNHDTLITLQVTDTLPDSIYNHPVTIRRQLPVGWPSADVLQQASPVNKRIVKADNTVFIVFDAIPDNGEIVLIKNNNAVIPETDTMPPDDDPVISNIFSPESNDFISQCPFKLVLHNNGLSLYKPSVIRSVITISLYDLNGRKVFTQKLNPGNDNNNIFLPLSTATGSFYVAQITDGMQSWSQKLILTNCID